MFARWARSPANVAPARGPTPTGLGIAAWSNGKRNGRSSGCGCAYLLYIQTYIFFFRCRRSRRCAGDGDGDRPDRGPATRSASLHPCTRTGVSVGVGVCVCRLRKGLFALGDTDKARYETRRDETDATTTTTTTDRCNLPYGLLLRTRRRRPCISRPCTSRPCTSQNTPDTLTLNGKPETSSTCSILVLFSLFLPCQNKSLVWASNEKSTRTRWRCEASVSVSVLSLSQTPPRRATAAPRKQSPTISDDATSLFHARCTRHLRLDIRPSFPWTALAQLSERPHFTLQ